MVIAKVFKSGNSQAVRLPKNYRVDADEVVINRIGDLLVLSPKGQLWDFFSEGIEQIGDDFPNKIDQLPESGRNSLE
jgi:antitoxin VapB